MPKKDYKLIRKIKEIIDNPSLHFWIKCKQLVKIKTYDRPSSYEGAELIRKFFKTCAGKYKDRFKTAYVRPYCDNWNDRSAYDYVNNAYLNEDPSAKIGRSPRGIKFVLSPENVHRAYESSIRFSRYLKRKYPEAFKAFEEIKKVQHHYGTAIEETEDCAWQHIFPRVSKRDILLEGETSRGQTTKEAQRKRRELDLAMEKAQTDNDLKKASKLPPRYLYNEVSLAEFQNDHKNHIYAIFKGHYITTETVLHYDNSEVHHGLGHLKYTDRKLLIRNEKGIVFSKVLKSYSGHFVLNAIEEYFGRTEKVQIFKNLKSVQLNPKMKVIETWEFGFVQNFRVFERLFAGFHYDYCVLRDGVTYHGPSIKDCIAGWKKKNEISKAGAKILNMKICKRFGFCPDGIRSFCSANNLDSHETYTIAEIKRIVSKNISYNRRYYGRELQQVGVL